MNKIEEIKRIRYSTAHIFGNKCAICGRKYNDPFTSGKFVYHHKYYKSSDVRHYRFKSELNYTKRLCVMVKKEPERFLLLCNGCHLRHFDYDVILRRLYIAKCVLEKIGVYVEDVTHIEEKRSIEEKFRYKFALWKQEKLEIERNYFKYMTSWKMHYNDEMSGRKAALKQAKYWEEQAKYWKGKCQTESFIQDFYLG